MLRSASLDRLPSSHSNASGGLAEAVWLYVWATGDGSLSQLANELVAWQHEEQEKEEAEDRGRLRLPDAQSWLTGVSANSRWMERAS